MPQRVNAQKIIRTIHDFRGRVIPALRDIALGQQAKGMVLGDARAKGSDLLTQIHQGLRMAPKQIPYALRWDDVGSALYDLITRHIPEYYLTAKEMEILKKHGTEITQAMSLPDSALVELGSGTSLKTRELLKRRPEPEMACHYVPVDFSRSALELGIGQLLFGNAEQRGFSNLWISALHASFEDAFAILAQMKMSASYLFLGSNIGNYSPEGRADFLGRLRETMKAGDTFAVGADLIKDRDVLETAYDDPGGVYAAMNKNVLASMQRSLGIAIDPRNFVHRAAFNPQEACVKQFLVSKGEQLVRVGDTTYAIGRGEHILTQTSYKFEEDSFRAEVEGLGFRVNRVFKDEEAMYSFWILSV
jgi:dimethylhistidine N-methyltransferase